MNNATNHFSFFNRMLLRNIGCVLKTPFIRLKNISLGGFKRPNTAALQAELDVNAFISDVISKPYSMLVKKDFENANRSIDEACSFIANAPNHKSVLFIRHLLRAELYSNEENFVGAIKSLKLAYSESFAYNGVNSPETLLVTLTFSRLYFNMASNSLASLYMTQADLIARSKDYSKRLKTLAALSGQNQNSFANLVYNLLLIEKFKCLNLLKRIYIEQSKILTSSLLSKFTVDMNSDLKLAFGVDLINLDSPTLNADYFLTLDTTGLTERFKVNIPFLLFDFYNSAHESLEAQSIEILHDLIEIQTLKNYDIVLIIPQLIYLIKYYSFTNDVKRMKLLLQRVFKLLDILSNSKELKSNAVYYDFLVEVCSNINFNQNESFIEYLSSAINRCIQYYKKEGQCKDGTLSINLAKLYMIESTATEDYTIQLAKLGQAKGILISKLGKQSEPVQYIDYVLSSKH